MPNARFVYEIYIAATVETVWKALLDGEFTRKYWEHENVSDWTPGSRWEHRRADSGKVAILGEVLEASPPNRLVITWADPSDRLQKTRHSRVTFEIQPVADMARLTITHEDLEPGSDMEWKISQGWPRVLSSLKSLLETGRPLKTWKGDDSLERRLLMATARETLEAFYEAVQRRDLLAARHRLDPSLTFFGLFETYRNADEYVTALTGLLSITTDLEVKAIIAEGENAAIFFELTTTAPAEARTLVAEWHVVRDGKIVQVKSAFDGRPFAPMFGAPMTPQNAAMSGSAADEQAIRALKDAFARALLAGNPKLRASLWSEDGTVVPPQGGFFAGRAAIEQHFSTEVAGITKSSSAAFGDYRMRFMGPDLALVDTLLTLSNVAGPDGSIQATVHVAIVFTAIKQNGEWRIQDERAHFTTPAAVS